MTRNVHLVGALPGDSPQEALDLAYSMVGPYLRSVPDGETGERRKWVIAIFDMMRNHPDVIAAKDYGGTYDPAVDLGQADPAEAAGKNWSDFDHIPRLKLRHWWHRPDPAHIRTGIVESSRSGYPVFAKARAEHGNPQQRFQIGFPGDFDMSLCSFGPQTVIAKPSFRRAIVRDITAVRRELGDDVVFQIEIPWQVLPVSMAPRLLRGSVAWYFARAMRSLVTRCPDGTNFGVHLCLGDMHHRSVVRLNDLGPVVTFTNEIVRHWPASHPLVYVHMPLAHGEEPPATSPAFYQPLRKLRIPAHVRLAAGFVHELRSEREQRELLAMLEDLAGRQLDVANSCGLGRQRKELAVYNLEQAAALAGERRHDSSDASR
jgi:hypothetical protein